MRPIEIGWWPDKVQEVTDCINAVRRRLELREICPKECRQHGFNSMAFHAHRIQAKAQLLLENLQQLDAGTDQASGILHQLQEAS